MTRPIPEEIISSWIIDEKHAGIVHAHLGPFHYLIEARIGHSPKLVSTKAYSSERDAVRAMFKCADAEPPAIASRRSRKTPASWSRIEE